MAKHGFQYFQPSSSGYVLAPALALELASSVWLLVLPINFGSEAESQDSWTNKRGGKKKALALCTVCRNTCVGPQRTVGTLRKTSLVLFLLPNYYVNLGAMTKLHIENE